MNAPFRPRLCRECKKPKVHGSRLLKYCSDECRKAVRHRYNVAYERRVKRPPHKYRKKKVENHGQLEFSFDSVR